MIKFERSGVSYLPKMMMLTLVTKTGEWWTGKWELGTNVELTAHFNPRPVSACTWIIPIILCPDVSIFIFLFPVS